MYSSGYFWYLIFCIPPLLLGLWASYNVRATYNKYGKIQNASGMTGAEAARRILAQNGISNVAIEMIRGDLTDHFDPKANVIRLSQDVYNSATPAAVGVAAHETGHAIQYANGYTPMKIRGALIPVANFGSQAGIWIVILGVILGIRPLAMFGVIAFGALVLFQLVTLPVEFNASNRAIKALREDGRMSETEISQSSKVLRAAALTYVAALASAVGSFLRLLMMVSGGRNRR
ncbi:MAG: zinc metallopeptidase [Clostridia bacterium]|nr:zinc metallopeptidase [Clostridia bacterium]